MAVEDVLLLALDSTTGPVALSPAPPPDGELLLLGRDGLALANFLTDGCGELERFRFIDIFSGCLQLTPTSFKEIQVASFL
jgi:hypothetical protein